ncbi:hypothetical protein ABC347_00950 [Sphingomonas sp. 1P06PA]|uniref:hypothetical protein n=1 Tax=Sphingomonas sp. 1P06PA TaxID=554121 RepID=UPI0039A5FBE3
MTRADEREALRLDEKLLSAFLKHLSKTPGTKENQRTKKTLKTENQFPALGDFIRGICKDPRHHRDLQYDVIARELPTIARGMGITTFDSDRVDDGRDPKTLIENALKYLSQGSASGLAKPMLAWAWERDEGAVAGFMADSKFKIEADEQSPAVTPIFRPAGEQADSLYDLKSVLALAEQRLILIAQNHWHMASKKDEYWPQIESALLRGVTVEIVAMHPNAGPEGRFLDRSAAGIDGVAALPADAVDMWTNYLRWPKFIPQLREMWEVLGDWRERHRALGSAQAKRLGRFKTYASYFQPNTITAIDLDMRKAIMVVSPRTSNSDSAGRPQFLIEKARDPTAFNFFWRYIDYGISNDMWPIVSD